jgi:anthranilate phosphoribosyltransferase
MNPGFAFLFAPSYHPAMKNVAPVRRDLGFRTVFNLLGPICNPAGVRRQLIGIFAREWLEPVAHVLAELGTEKAWIVHGADGLDELSTTGPTRVAILEDGRVTMRDIVPEDAGIERTSLAALKGGTAEDNARAIRDLFSGAKGAFRGIVLLNAAAALIAAGQATNLKDGVAQAAEAIDKGRAAAALEQARQQRNA